MSEPNKQVKEERKLELSEEDCHHLMNYFMAEGYISHEFHAPVHEIVSRIRLFIDGPQQFKPLKRVR